ncbi:uncharacterized protein LOC109851496 [Asparagus officinalis]|uniref:uncharacterized protein LOC109851496 n=1 Tax=Asparagus officinalis TaxID=4686 RepID=UPI00098DFFD5|nr:uncharacterized protein LOC109851496 [Asparagus officinalis]
MRFRVVDSRGNAIPNATIVLNQKRPGFPFGSSMDSIILSNTAYQNWFTSRFTVTTFGNEMKWYSTENFQGKEDYHVCDAMIAFAKQHGIRVRGHNIVWDDPQYIQTWIKALSEPQLEFATNKRINSVVSRYRGQVIAWDVVNENLHFSFFEDRMGKGASGSFYQKASQLDPNTLMFLNDFNTLEVPGDVMSTPAKYLQKLNEMWSFPGNKAKMAIGLEGHFGWPNIPYMRSALDTLANAKVPIWLTEVDVSNDANQVFTLL